jgi:hypothetical protein
MLSVDCDLGSFHLLSGQIFYLEPGVEGNRISKQVHASAILETFTYTLCSLEVEAGSTPAF